MDDLGVTSEPPAEFFSDRKDEDDEEEDIPQVSLCAHYSRCGDEVCFLCRTCTAGVCWVC